MKNENILADIKSKSLKEARAEIDAILGKLESQETDLNESINDYQRLIELNKHSLSFSFSLKPDLRSISKITFCANLSVSPIDTEL